MKVYNKLSSDMIHKDIKARIWAIKKVWMNIKLWKGFLYSNIHWLLTINCLNWIGNQNWPLTESLSYWNSWNQCETINKNIFQLLIYNKMLYINEIPHKNCITAPQSYFTIWVSLYSWDIFKIDLVANDQLTSLQGELSFLFLMYEASIVIIFLQSHFITRLPVQWHGP